MMTQQGAGVGVKAGVRFGIPLAVFAAIITVLYDTGHVPTAFEAVEFVIALACFFVAGMMAARQSRRATIGALAGGICGFCFAIVILGADVIMAAVAPAQFASAFGYHDLSTTSLINASVIQSLIGLVLWVIFGLVLGILGGLIGRRQKVKQPADATAPVTG